MLKNCPDPLDVQDLQFKLQCRLKVFDNKDLNAFKSPSLLSCASRYGLLFIGSNSPNLQAIQIKCLENYSPKDKDISNYPRRTITLPSPPKHICVNCDSTLLAVVIERDKCSTVIFYDVLSILKQNITIIKEARLSSTPNVYVSEINWNPALPPIFTACKSDGTLGVYEIKDNSISINELPTAAEAISFCWSPKGKQIAVGSRNGKITQYKPDLKAVKVINAPPLESPHSLISLQWVSNYQFVGIYQAADPEGSAKLIVVDAPKTGEVTYTNYEDVCYSGNSRLPQFYMILQQHWNILMVASSNSTELGVLGSNKEMWTQWIISDSARVELPLSSDHQETLPVGLALDISSTRPLPWNESFVPPCPYLLILSHQGVLCIFNVVNLKEGIPSICTPPDPISDTSGIQQFIVPIESVTASSENVSLTTAPKAPMFSFAPAQDVSSSQPLTLTTKVLTQPQPTYVPPTSLFGNPNDGKRLLGGQATLTPINPQQPTTQASLFGGQTLITPINKLQTSTPSTTTTATSNNKYSSIFAAVNTPASTPISIPTKPIVISTPVAPNPEHPVEQHSVVQPKPSISISSGKPSESKTAIGIKIKGEKDALLAQMIREECICLETELKSLLHQGRSIKIDVGSEDEKFDMVTRIESLQEFVKEIVDISIGENAEVHYLKQNLIQCWAWFEEARSRYNSSKDETMSLLLKSQPLDSATEKRAQDITKLMYYIESQITQASKALDEQWDNFQDYAKKIHRTKMPTMETIFQTMVRQNAILQKQTYILKDIASRLKSKSRTTDGPSLLLTLENTKDLEGSLRRLQLSHPQDIHELQYERVLKRIKNLSTSKTSKLRDLLKSREVRHVSVVKPQLSSSVVLQSPESRSRQLISNLSTLSTQVSPVTKTSAVPRQLNFVHSTPIREPSIDIKSTETPPNTPQIDPKTFTFKKIEKSSSAATAAPASNFSLPVKSTSIFSNVPQGNVNISTLPTHSLSAFVPTTQVTFGTSASKPFSFTPTVTSTATTTPGSVATVPAFSSITTTSISKFGMPTISQTTVSNSSMPITITKITPDVKTTSQFNFGSSISITPVTVPKKISPVTTSFGVSTTKPVFNFGGTTTFVTPNESSTTSKTKTPTTTSSSFTFGSTPLSTGTSPFGAISSTSKVSAFTVVSTNVPSSTGTIPATTQISTPTSKPDDQSATTTLQPILAQNVTSTTLGSGSGTTTSSAVTKLSSLFGSTIGLSDSTKSQSFGIPTPASMPIITIPTPTTPSSASFFSTISTATKPSMLPPSTSTTQSTTLSTTSSSTIASSTTPASITTQSTIVKPPLIVSSSTEQSSTTSSSIVAPKTSQASIFNNSTSTTQSSIFGASVPTPTSSVFGGTSIFGQSTQSPTTSSIFGGTTTQSSIFGTSAASTTTSSIFGGTTQASLFSTSAPATTSSIFGGSSIFGKSSTLPSTPPTTTSSVFGNTTTTPSSIFATSTAPITTSSIFGGTTTSQSSTLGAPISSTTTKPSIFGAAIVSTQPSIFGATAPVSTQQSSIFASSTNASQTSIFGTTQASIFGGTTASTTKPSSIFGTTTSAPVCQPSVFAATSVPSTQSSVFPTNTVASPFGSSFGTTTTTASSSPFRQSTSIFGTPKTTESSFGSTFGSPSTFGSTPVSSAPAFGQPATFGSGVPAFGTTTTSANVFGSATGSSTFGASTSSANIFGAPVSSSSSFSFAAAPNSTSNTGTFGFGALNFGNTASTTGSIFGGSTTFGSSTPQTDPFARTTEQKSVFGGSNVFGSPVSTSSSAFGSGTTSAFGSNTQSGFGTSAFGSPSTFGQQSTFGQSSFGNTSFGSTPGPFSGGGAAVGQTGFGSPATFQNPSGFGSAPVFGGSPQPAFGATPSFGGAPTFRGSPPFGGAPTFGSPSTVFGSSGSTGFGSAATPSTGFGSLANQNTVGFGSLAQQAPTTTAATFPATTTFSGSSSFLSWR